MILISCRKGFTDSRRFAERNVIRDYPRLPKLDNFQELDEGTLAERLQGQHVLVLVHGFRNTLSDVGSAYQRLLEELTNRGMVGEHGYGIVIGFTWPGFEKALGFLPAVPFANRSAGFFRPLLELATRNAKTVDVQTHSLGARVALQTLAGGTAAFVDNLMTTAAAIDDEVLEPLQEFNQSLVQCRRCFVYHSARDRILKFAYRVGDAPNFDRALGLKGPEHPKVIKDKCPDVLVVDCEAIVGSHGAYRAAPKYYTHWERVLGDEPLDQFEKIKA